MGIFNVQLEVGDPDGQRYETVEAMVDSGAAYTFIPTSVLTKLGIRPHRRVTFELADGSQIEREVGWARVRLNGDSESSPVVFSDENITPLLGAVTLELLNLGIDPVNTRLIPVRPRL